MERLNGTNIKVGDKVAAKRYSTIDFVDTVLEITKAGNIRLTNSPTVLYNKDGFIRGGGTWQTTIIYRITDKEYDDYFALKRIRSRIKDIRELLASMSERELLNLESILNDFYTKISFYKE